MTKEVKIKLSKSIRKGFQNGRTVWNKGKGEYLSKEARARVTAAATGRKHTSEWKKQHSKDLKGRKFSSKHRKNISKALIGKQKTEEAKKNMRIAQNKLEVKERLKQPKSKKHAQKIARALKLFIASLNIEEKNKRMKNIYVGMHKRPNKPETIILNLLNKQYPGEWEYTGDGSLWINGKCPDFICINGQKKLIELFGNYWHRNDNSQDRINVFKLFGYDTLVIWEKELKNISKVTNKIQRFILK